jgi:hypothetical protein
MFVMQGLRKNSHGAPGRAFMVVTIFICCLPLVAAFVMFPSISQRTGSSYDPHIQSNSIGTSRSGLTGPFYLVPSHESMETLVWIAQQGNEDLPVLLSSSSSEALSKSTAIAIFIVGLIPFAIATVEFWRRIATREPFGTNDPIYFTIGEDDNPMSSRGRRTLGTDALVTAYIIFAIVAVVLGVVIASVVTSPDTYSAIAQS